MRIFLLDDIGVHSLSDELRVRFLIYYRREGGLLAGKGHPRTSTVSSQ